MFGRAQLSSALSNPHVKLFPALHRKLPAEGPTVTASASVWDLWDCGGGSTGRDGWMRGSVSVLAVGGAERVGAATGQLWKPQSPHANKALKMFAPSWLVVFPIQSAILYNPNSGKSAPSVKCVCVVKGGRGRETWRKDLLFNFLLIAHLSGRDLV